MEASLTCMACMSLLTEPVTCTPCGHTFCAGCVRSETGGGGDYQLAVCPECEGQAGRLVSVDSLATLVPNFQFQRQSLAMLQADALTAATASKFKGLLPAPKA